MAWFGTSVPVKPNYGKAVVVSRFESTAWMGEVLVWATGEAELSTIRLADELTVNKHYDLLTPADLGAMLDELVALLSSGSIPNSAITSSGTRT